jgi:hypothetical protein
LQFELLLPGNQVHWHSKPVGDCRSVAFRNEFAPQAADGREVEPDGSLQNQERNEGDNSKT